MQQGKNRAETLAPQAFSVIIKQLLDFVGDFLKTLIFAAGFYVVFECVTVVFKPTDFYHKLAGSREQVPLVKTPHLTRFSQFCFL